MTTATTDYLDEMRACAEAIDLNPPAYVLPEDRSVELNGVNFHYLDWGNDHLPHLVLLHGGSLTAHTWDMASLLLHDRYHVIALDQRGHGDTGWTPDDQLDRDNGDLMLEDTRAFIEHLGYDHLVLCGMSMGGMNAIRYAAGHPERLDALVVVDIAPVTMSAGIVEMEQFRQDTETMSRFEDFLERAVNFNPQRKPAHLKYSLLHSLKQVDDGWTWKQDHRRRTVPAGMTEDDQKQSRELRSEALANDVKAIETPTLLLRGSISKILSKEAANAMTEAMPDCTHVVIEGAGHSVQGDQPAAMAAAVDAYLSEPLGR
jgi:pimeloyl-ACP methyl ester carboxylesterase